jgi:hypothetical protein
VRRLVVETHQLRARFLRDCPVDEFANCEMLDNGLSPDALDAQVMLGVFSEDEIVSPENPSRRQRGDRSLEALPTKHSFQHSAPFGIQRCNLGH